MAGMAISAIPAAVSTVGSLMGMFGEDEASTPPMAYVPSTFAQQQNFDQYQGLLGNFYGGATQSGINNYPATNYPYFSSEAYGIVNNPYAPQAMEAALRASQLGAGVGQRQIDAGTSLYGLGDVGVPYASRILETGFDPQGALRAREEQRLSDQTLAAMNRMGVGTSPYGAGVLGQTMGNFGLDWQDRALGRMGAAARGYGDLTSTIGRGYAGGAELGNLGLGTIATSGALPYQTSLAQHQNALGALGQLNQAGMQTWQLPQNTLGNIMGLIRGQQQQIGTGLDTSKAAFGQQQTYGANLGAGLAGLTKGIGDYFKPQPQQGGWETAGGYGWNTPEDPYGLWGLGGMTG